MWRLGGQLGDVVEVDVVIGASGGSHYGLQALLDRGNSNVGNNGRRDARLPKPG